MSLNTKRLASDIGKQISIIILEESTNDTLKSITITGCEVTTDLSFCKLYYSYYGTGTKEEVQTELENCIPFLKRELAKAIEMRHIPELIFVKDDSIEYGNNIDKLLSEIHKND